MIGGFYEVLGVVVDLFWVVWRDDYWFVLVCLVFEVFWLFVGDVFGVGVNVVVLVCVVVLFIEYVGEEGCVYVFGIVFVEGDCCVFFGVD